MANAYQPGLRVSEYVLEQPLGTGSFSEVWRARHHVWDSERVAVKLPSAPEYVRYIQQEGLVVHGLRHPNIVRVLGLDPYAEVPYLVMELVAGKSLRELLNEHDRGLPLPTVLTILRSTLAALAAAHANGVLHRDLKPGNVLLALEDDAPLERLGTDQVKVSDFGLGIRDTETLRSIVQSISLERDSTVVGTLAYLAPELRDQQAQADARSDLYAVGIMLFEMLTGERPAGAELPSTVRAETPRWLDDVFRKLYARRESRFESAEAVLRELDRQQPVPPPPRVPAALETVGGRRSCQRCGHVPDATDQYCTQCGTQLVERVRRCPSCSAYPAHDARFCTQCGTPLGTEVA